MPIPTSRAKDNALIFIDEDLCNDCGLCVKICKDFSLEIIDGKIQPSTTPLFGCYGCGQCMAICSRNAIRVEGRTLSPFDLFRLPEKESMATYDQTLHLFQNRRSIREFTDKTVKKYAIEKVIEAASNSPMGLPPSDVSILVLENKEMVRQFAKDYCEYLEKMKWIVSRWFMSLMKPFWGKKTNELFKGFLKPLINIYTDNMKNGKNLVTYDAPAALYFYASQYADPADPIVAATHAMIAAESLGLGTCMIGGVHPFIQNGSTAKKFRERYNIRSKSKEGLILLLGYSKYKFTKGIHRSFAHIDRLN